MKKELGSAEQLFYWISIASLLAGGILWLTSIDNKASAAQSSVIEANQKLDKVQSQYQEIRERLIRIEDKLN